VTRNPSYEPASFLPSCEVQLKFYNFSCFFLIWTVYKTNDCDDERVSLKNAHFLSTLPSEYEKWFLVRGLSNCMSVCMYRMFSAQADWTLTHTSYEDTEQGTIEASITLDGVTLTDPLIS
jgi:hypothetical protein